MSGLYFGLILALEAATMGVYVSLDLMLFFLFWELTLIPTFFLITVWGVGAERRYAGTKYVLTMLAGGIPLLFGILIAGMELTVATGISPAAGLSFDYVDLLNRPGRQGSQAVVFLLLLLGFGVKAPILPLHTWLPTVAMEGPPGLTATLVGLKLGAYGIIRFAVPLAPDVATEYGWHIGLLGAIGVVYGALLALHQANLRRMLAFASVSHVGLVLVGVSALNVQGVQGAILQTLNFTVVASGLMLLAGAVHRRFGSTDVASLGGLWRAFPRLSALFLILGLASIGVPGTSGFVAEYLILVGVVRAHPGTAVLALSGAILGAAYFLGFVRDAFFGPWTASRGQGLRDLQPREMAVVLAMAVLVVLGGIFPGPILGTSAQAAAAWSAPFGDRR
jgi:NADH-quinone oxidoreductase subunit M